MTDTTVAASRRYADRHTAAASRRYADLAHEAVNRHDARNAIRSHHAAQRLALISLGLAAAALGDAIGACGQATLALVRWYLAYLRIARMGRS